KVEHGSRLVDTAGQTMTDIVTSVQHVADIMSEITAASQEQSAGIEQVNLAVTQMDEMTQQNAALVEEAAAAAESMREQSGKLSELVSQFHIMEQAQKPAVQASRPAHTRRQPVIAKASGNSANAGKAQVRQIPQRKSKAVEQDWEEF
ncbi:MAG: methyl-accepting chemotaxis protein, partial [Burkholderiales bacterium]|nr:methyl-accepting chemotaxis protein [Burkholderiales bacterium]